MIVLFFKYVHCIRKSTELRSLRKSKLYDKMLSSATIFLGFDKLRTMEYLKMGLKSG